MSMDGENLLPEDDRGHEETKMEEVQGKIKKAGYPPKDESIVQLWVVFVSDDGSQEFYSTYDKALWPKLEWNSVVKFKWHWQTGEEGRKYKRIIDPEVITPAPKKSGGARRKGGGRSAREYPQDSGAVYIEGERYDGVKDAIIDVQSARRDAASITAAMYAEMSAQGKAPSRKEVWETWQYLAEKAHEWAIRKGLAGAVKRGPVGGAAKEKKQGKSG